MGKNLLLFSFFLFLSIDSLFSQKMEVVTDQKNALQIKTNGRTATETEKKIIDEIKLVEELQKKILSHSIIIENTTKAVDKSLSDISLFKKHALTTSLIVNKSRNVLESLNLLIQESKKKPLGLTLGASYFPYIKENILLTYKDILFIVFGSNGGSIPSGDQGTLKIPPLQRLNYLNNILARLEKIETQLTLMKYEVMSFQEIDQIRKKYLRYETFSYDFSKDIANDIIRSFQKK